MPTLGTARLTIRILSIEDLDAIHHILDVELQDAETGSQGATSLAERAQWLQWTIMSYEQLAKLHQPPYGERAVVLKETGQVIGACGFVPCLNAFQQLPAFSCGASTLTQGFTSTEFGLYYAISPAHRRRGYATEAAQAMLGYAFQELGLQRVVATTTYGNAASIAVMERLGMQIERNPKPDPPWLQVVGVLGRGAHCP